MTETEEAQYRARFRGGIDALSTFKPDTLLRAGKEVSFEQAAPLFSRIYQFVELLKSVSWENVPGAKVHALLDPVESLKRKLEEVRNFSGTQGEPSRTRDQLVLQLEAEFNRAYTDLVAHLSFELITGASNVVDRLRAEWNTAFGASARQMEEARQELAKQKEQLSDAVKDAQKKQEKLNAIVEQVQNDAQKQGVKDQAVHFAGLADECVEASKRWLGAACVFAAAIIGFLFFVTSSLSSDISSTRSEITKTNSVAAVSTNTVSGAFTSNVPPSQNQLPTTHPPSDILTVMVVVVPRVVILTVLLSGLVFCLRNYAAASHNRVVNRHRETALNTFEVFVKSANDDTTKNAVLLQATQAIFAPQPSGYLKSDNEVSQLPQVSVIADLMRGGSKSEKT